MLNFNDGKEKQQKILKHRHCLYQYVPLQKRRIWFKSSPTIRRIPASCVTCSTCRHNTWLIISKRSCFKLEKNLNKVFPGKVRDQKYSHKDDVCREGLGSTCADGWKLLTGFILIAYSSKLVKFSLPRNENWLEKLYESSLALFQGKWKFCSWKSTS